MTNSTGGDYDGHTYNNIQFTAEGSDANQKWTGASTIELSMNEGNCYAYYPYSTAVSDVTQIPVSTAGQADYMYATPVTVNAGNKEASLKMKHALSAVRFMIKKGSYTGAGQVTAVSVRSNALGTSGTLNAITGELTGVSGKGSTISVSKSLKLSTATQNVDVIVVPTGTAANLTLSVTLDGKTYSTVVGGALVTKACCNQYTLTVNVGKLALSGVEIGDWGYNDSGAPTIKAGSYKVTFAGNYSNLLFSNTVSSDGVVTIKTRALDDESMPFSVTKSGTASLNQVLEGKVRTIAISNIASNITVTFKGSGVSPTPLQSTWSGLPDGVYAVSSDLKPVAVSDANEFCGVGFVVNGKAYQVAKTDATGYDGAETVYWWKNSPRDIQNLTSYTTADGTNSKGYFPRSGDDGDWFSSPHLDHDWTKWSNYNNTAALSDFNGQANTDLIIAAQTTDGVVQDYTLAKAVVDFRGNSTVNEGQTDWFAPALGELAFMYLKRGELYDLLSKVGGTTWLYSYDYSYWSSSEYGSDYAWDVCFGIGYTGRHTKSGNFGLLRLVRAI